MLINTFKIHICWIGEIFVMIEYRIVAHTRIKPNIQNIFLFSQLST